MKAVDTNVLARYILGDDPEQARRAAAVLREPCFVSDTVLLELAWLLKSRFTVPRTKLAAILRKLLTMPTLTFADRALASWAVERFGAGADFADMLHIATAGPADTFVSFDDRMARQAGPDAPVPIEQPPA